MSRLRPECGSSNKPALTDETALYLIRDAVAKRRSLIYGRLDDGNGNYCAMGAFWEDNPEAVVYDRLLNEVASVNDSVPPSETAHKRWKKVNSWLRWRLRVLAGANGGGC